MLAHWPKTKLISTKKANISFIRWNTEYLILSIRNIQRDQGQYLTTKTFLI